MPHSSTAFDTIEGTQAYMQLLGDAVDEALRDAAEDLAQAGGVRERDALRLVDCDVRQAVVLQESEGLGAIALFEPGVISKLHR